MTNLKVAVVGAGRVAQNSYLPCLSQDSQVALGYYSRTRARAETAAATFGGQVFDSPAALMAWAPDTVFILTREMDRFDAAMAVLERGPKRLFLEKPLVARNGQENVSEQDFLDGRRLTQEAERRGCETAMIFNYRFFDHTLLAHRIAAELAIRLHALSVNVGVSISPICPTDHKITAVIRGDGRTLLNRMFWIIIYSEICVQGTAITGIALGINVRIIISISIILPGNYKITTTARGYGWIHLF